MSQKTQVNFINCLSPHGGGVEINMYDYKSLVIKNRSYRSYDPNVHVTKEELAELVDCARLSASGANRQCLKFKLCTDDAERAFICDNTKMGAALPKLKLPPVGHEPMAYIVICADRELILSRDIMLIDVGIAAQAITLAASDRGLGGCMIAAFDREKLGLGLSLDERLEAVLVIAIGHPDEFSFIAELGDDGKTTYFRDDKGVHFVPKRSLSDIII